MVQKHKGGPKGPGEKQAYQSALPSGAQNAPMKRPVSESGPGFNRAEVNYDKYR